MKERPILFSGEMVRAILAGQKTQTRRIVKESNRKLWEEISCSRCQGQGTVGCWQDGQPGQDWCSLCGGNGIDFVPRLSACPYGKDGDLLWVRETWRALPEYDHLPPREIPVGSDIWYAADADEWTGFGKVRPGIFLPRWASRITLTVTGVLVERVQDLTEEDAIAEGCSTSIAGPNDGPFAGGTYTAKLAYMMLWDKINGPGAWASNPWVWAIAFARTALKSNSQPRGDIALARVCEEIRRLRGQALEGKHA